MEMINKNRIKLRIIQGSFQKNPNLAQGLGGAKGIVRDLYQRGKIVKPSSLIARFLKNSRLNILMANLGFHSEFS
jgi:hypothetical protein